MVISWNGLLGRDCGRTKRIVFTFVRKRDYTPATLDRIWEIFAWSVNRMAIGKHPLLDWDRKPIPGAIESPLAGPFTAILTQIRGDWQFYVEIFHFPPLGMGLFACVGCAERRVPISFWRLLIVVKRQIGGIPDSQTNRIVPTWLLWVLHFLYFCFLWWDYVWNAYPLIAFMHWISVLALTSLATQCGRRSLVDVGANPT